MSARLLGTVSEWAAGKRAASLLAGLAVLALLWASVRAGQYAWNLAAFPYQVEAREAAQVRTTLALAEGANPWGPGRAPSDYNSYGLLYPWTALQVLPASLQRDIRAYRVLSLAALLAGALLLIAALRRSAAPWLVAWGAGLAWLGANLHFVTPTARCDAFAALLFLAPFLAVLDRDTRGAWALAGLLSVLAFFSKPYAVLAGPLLALGLWVRGRTRAALLFGAGWALLLAAAVAWVELRYPGYLEATTLEHARSTHLDWGYLLTKDWTYVRGLAWPILLLLAGALWGRRHGRALLAELTPLAGVLILLQGFMGRHTGAYLQYHFHLLHPLLILAGFTAWRRTGLGWRWPTAAFTVAAVAGVSFGTQRLAHLRQADLQSWRRAELLIRASAHPFAGPELCSVLTAEGKPVYDNGQTEFLMDAAGPLGPALRASVLDSQAEFRRRLLAGGIDLLIIPDSPALPAALRSRYQDLGLLALPLPVELDPGRTLRALRLRSAARIATPKEIRP